MRDFFERLFPKYGRPEPRVRLPDPLPTVFGAISYLSGFGLLPIAMIIGSLVMGEPQVAFVGAAWLATLFVAFYFFSN